MFSITKFAITDETGELFAVSKNCLKCFPRNVKLVKQISNPLIRLVVENLCVDSVQDRIEDIA